MTLPYETEISRRNPAAFFFVIDQSPSMGDPIAGSAKSKASMLCTVINRVINELCVRNQEGDEVLSRFEIALIGYGNETYGQSKIGSAFDGKMIKIPAKMPIWLEFDPKSGNGTPMASAMRHTHDLVRKWVADHPNSFPPVILHATDGEPNEGGDPLPQRRHCASLPPTMGISFLFTVHLSGNSAQPLVFADNEKALPNDFARMLFHMSSVMPDKWRMRSGESMGRVIGQNARAFIYNADVVSMVQFLEIGTRSPTER